MVENNNELGREGENADIHYAFTKVEAANGVPVVVPNCMQCHAGSIDGQFIFGLGHNMVDNTMDQGLIAPVLETIVKNRYGESSDEYAAFTPFYQAIKATSGQLKTDVVGVSSADKLAVVLAAHRTQKELMWSDEPLSNIPQEVIPADIPAWWLIKKKNAMFSTGIGRKDFARVMMASSILN